MVAFSTQDSINDEKESLQITNKLFKEIRLNQGA